MALKILWEFEFKNEIGFKSKHRTSDHLLTLRSVVLLIPENPSIRYGIMGLFHKVASIGFAGKSLDIYQNTRLEWRITQLISFITLKE